MARRVSWIPTVVCFVMFALPAPASATRVVVPDNFPTIQAAINSGADTVAIRDGLPPERLAATGVVTLVPIAGVDFRNQPGWVSMPRIQSLEITQAGGYQSPTIHAHGIHFLGAVSTAVSFGFIEFEGCRFDSSVVLSQYNTFLQSSIRSCTFLSDVYVAGYAQFNGNTVIGATASIWADGQCEIRDNYVLGPAKDGLRLDLVLADGVVSNNTIRGTSNGIHFLSTEGTRTSRNDIADCSTNGILYEPGWSASCDSNLVQRCGGAGILAIPEPGEIHKGSAWMVGNIVRQTGGVGIDLSKTVVDNFSGNQVLDAGGDGVRVLIAGHVEGNVIGRCSGEGVHVAAECHDVEGNTVFSNRGIGIELAGDAYEDDSLTNNLSAFNGGAGFLFAGSHGENLNRGCNDWFGNAGGATSGLAPGATDLQVDPLFCSLSAGEVHLASNSPLLAAPGCGLIGALGQGCGATAEVEPALDSAPTRFRVWPVPSRGVIGFELPRSPNVSRVEVFDVAGARRWSKSVPAGVARVDWDGRGDDGHPAAAGVYFARLTRGDVSLGTARVVLAK
jgi:hypothetical protein